jgi:hypothetical protein
MRANMLRWVPRPLAPPFSSRRPAGARCLHQVRGNFIDDDAKGPLVSTKVPIVLGDPGQTFVLVMPDIGRALYAASLHHAKSTTSGGSKPTEDRCKVTFFHDSQHFGFGMSCSAVNSKSLLRLDSLYRAVKPSPAPYPHKPPAPDGFKHKPSYTICDRKNA